MTALYGHDRVRGDSQIVPDEGNRVVGSYRDDDVVVSDICAPGDGPIGDDHVDLYGSGAGGVGSGGVAFIEA
ncbi:hypothetical protein I551_0804 [Mycobacterium ulcerans str. Harvey]|uniref:Uncharacterized protein n=1 Tax=Mycobacterium ulcerans str. Harvey TaxID=1299332 RepID=A0ABP3APQ6_MYCUL|nr:hypothetical protein I551_0804 [Mycobacterium ulcerans str. Harvey]